MALFSLPPSSPQSDATLNLFMKGNATAESSKAVHRTLLPEWFPQSAIEISWPHAGTDWAYMLEEVTRCYLRLAFEIATRQPLVILTPEPERVRCLIEEQLPRRATCRIHYFQCPTDDTWARDFGFLTVGSSEGIELLDFRFNGWGGKFGATKDNATNALMHSFTPSFLHGNYVNCLDLELEGGSIETDGQGTLLTTSECLLNDNRNSHMDKAAIEQVLQERLGVSHILWLDHGYLAGDDTDSHVDTLARLCPNDTIVYVQCKDTDDEHHEALSQMEEQLRTFRTPEGKPYRLIPLPMAAPAYDTDGERLPATYANYLVMNEAVLYPTYDHPALDAAAAQAIRQAYPDRDVVGVDCRALICQHGSLHCATMQYPRGVVSFPEDNHNPEQQA